MKQLMENYCFPSIPSKRKEKVQQGSRLLRWMDVQYTRDINSYINSEQNEYHQDNRDGRKQNFNKSLRNCWTECLLFDIPAFPFLSSKLNSYYSGNDI